MPENSKPITQAEMDALLAQAGAETKKGELSKEEIDTLIQTIASPQTEGIDALTGCKLGKFFTNDFERMIANAGDEYTDVTLAMLDLDHFMRVNDTFGHKTGDDVLAEVGKILLAIDVEKDVYRCGGEEFSIIFPNMEKERAFLIMEKVREEISKADECAKTSTTVSMGIATYPEDGAKQTELIRKADGAMYRAKSSGRNKVCLAKEEKLVTKTAHYTVEQLKRLKELSESQSTVEAVLMREALDDLLKKYNAKKTLERTVVLIDDAAFMRMMQKDVLSKNGYTVVGEAADGIEGLEVIGKTNPDFVLLDITMPNMDGLAMLKELRKTIKPKTHVIMVSAMGQASYITESYKNGADTFIVKPFQADRLISAVSNIGAYTIPVECIPKFTEIVSGYGVDKLTQQQIDDAREKSMQD